MRSSTTPSSPAHDIIILHSLPHGSQEQGPVSLIPTRPRRKKHFSSEGSLFAKLGIKRRESEAANLGSAHDSSHRTQDKRRRSLNDHGDRRTNYEPDESTRELASSRDSQHPPSRPQYQHQSRIQSVPPTPPPPPTSDFSPRPRPSRPRVWWRDLPFASASGPSSPFPRTSTPSITSSVPPDPLSRSFSPHEPAPSRPDAVTSSPPFTVLPQLSTLPKQPLTSSAPPRGDGEVSPPENRAGGQEVRHTTRDQVFPQSATEKNSIERSPTMSDDNSLSGPSSPASSSNRSRAGSLRDRKAKSRRSLVRKAGEASLRASGEFSRVGSIGGGGGGGKKGDYSGVLRAEGVIFGDEDEGELHGAERGGEMEEEGDMGIGEETVPAEDFLLDAGAGGEGLSFDESDLRLQLGDVESSFLPDLTAVVAPAGAREAEGRDDTYLELADPGRTPGVRRGRKIGDGEEEEDEEDLEEGVGESPTVAAAERIHTRGGRGEGSPSRQPSSAQQPASKNSTIRSGSNLRPEEAPLPQSRQSSMLSVDGGAPTISVHRRASRRNGLKNRQASYQSVDSSLTLGSDVSSSDGTMNADIALQTRGAMSTNATMRTSRRKNLLQRLPSLGSVSSHMTGDESRDVSAQSLLASRLGNSANGGDDGERPETPRANTSHFRAPTDTVVAQHVQSIQVPDTIARDFMARNRSMSPDKRPISSGGLLASLRDRPKKTLTLKEQNNKIDKLTKENFDLKLKIHFLDQALQNRSDDGIKDLIEKNVQLQTDLANERKEAQSLRRKSRELERKLKELEESLAEARSRGLAKDGEHDDPTLQGEMHEEILHLRQQLDRSENQVTTLTEEVMTKEFEKRKMAEHMRDMAGKRGEDTAGVKETMDMWQGLLDAETGRRELAEEELGRLRDELNTLRIQHVSPTSRRSDLSRGLNGSLAGLNAAQHEQLKHENSELRRDLSAQTSMLTSRNRERERLQQEIEDLKLMFRKGDGARSIAGDSASLDRAIPRAHQPSVSRASTHTDITEAERDDWEKKEGLLRDQNAELRIKFQELERTHNTHLQYVAVLEGDYRDMETDLGEIQEDLLKMQSERDEALHAYDQQEAEYEQLREEALAEISALDDEKKMLEAQLEDAIGKAHRLQAKLQNTSDGYKGVQGELRDITQSVINLEDEKQANMRTIQTLEQQIAEAEDEIQKWERKCAELDEKNRKLEVTQESLHSEITFLREEQEGDKIKIGELEGALSAAQQNVQDEQERMREMEESMLEERQQRDVLENQSKEEVQRVLDDVNAENTRTKDEVRKLRRSLSAREVEVSTWKQRLDELEENLRHALGAPDGTKQSLLADIEKIQRDMEGTASELDRAKMDLADKDRLLRHRDGLLESTSLESRRLSDLLDRERASRKHDLDQFDKASRGQATQMRTIAQQESRLLELETTYGQDKRKMAALEQQYREQLRERNNLLLALWNRLSTLCGVEWAQNHSLVNGENPSIDVINRHPAGFSSNIISAIKTIETLIGNFKSRIRSIERDVARSQQSLEHNLDLRSRRIELLERTVKETQVLLDEHAASSTPSSSGFSPKKSALARSFSHSRSHSNTSKNTEEILRLKSEVKLLKSELKASRQQQQQHGAPSASNQAGNTSDNPRRTPTSPARAIASLLRHGTTASSSSTTTTSDRHRRPEEVAASPPRGELAGVSSSRSSSSAAVEGPAGSRIDDEAGGGVSGSGSGPGPGPTPGPLSTRTERQWRLQLAEMERQLKQERDGRRLDREGARARLLEGKQEVRELREELERERGREV